MKHYEEIANRVLERRDEYVARQNQKRKTMMKIASVTCAFALVALVGFGVWQAGGQNADPVGGDTLTSTPPETIAPTESDGPGIGGDVDEECKEHNMYYHRTVTLFMGEKLDAFLDSLGEERNPEDVNIVNLVRYCNISREEFIAAHNGMWTQSNLDEIAWNHGNGCPYTKNQFLDAIYGDDAELTAWVFAPCSTWPEADCWDLLGENMDEKLGKWPPEGYGFGEIRPVDEEE